MVFGCVAQVFFHLGLVLGKLLFPLLTVGLLVYFCLDVFGSPLDVVDKFPHTPRYFRYFTGAENEEYRYDDQKYFAGSEIKE